MVAIVLLTLGEDSQCACDNGACGTRTPILACRDALRTASAQVETVVAHNDAEIDAALKARPDARLIVATAADGQLRAVMRRLVRLHAPAASQRPEALAEDRTMPDLPPIGVLPLGPDPTDLATRLGLPRSPAEVAAAVLAGHVRRLDLLRNDGGSVTLDGALLGGVDASGTASTYLARVEVDDAVLADGTEPVLMSVVANAGRYATVDGLPLVTSPVMDDGVLDVAVALPRASRRLFRRPRVEIEVRRAHGRAVAIIPRVDVPFVDDGVQGTLSRKRSWWMERGAWGVYVP